MKEFTNEISGLIDKILNIDLDSGLKVEVYEHLQEIRSALEEYQLFGSKRVQRSIESAVGTIALNPQLFQKAKDNELVKRFCNVLTKLWLSFSSGKGLPEIAGEVIYALLPSSSSSSVDIDNDPPSG